MLILDGSLADISSCVQRGYESFLVALFASVAFTAVALPIMRFRMTEDASDPKSSGGKLGVYSAIALLILVIFLVSSLSGLARNRTVLFLENDQLVERGCAKLRAFEDRFPLKELRSSYDFHRKSESHRLLLWPSPTERRLVIPLEASSQFANLAIVAPDAMRDYVRKLEELGKPIPAALK